MNETYFIIVAAVFLGGILLRLLVPAKQDKHRVAIPLRLDEAELRSSARHYKYFPQIRQALSTTDADYLRKNATSEVARRALRERRAVARRFLRGLNQDFSALARLGRMIAVLSPEVSHKQETERLILSLRFQAVYRLVWLRLWVGALPLHQLEVLAGLVGRLAIRLDEAMAEINALSARELAGKLST